MSKNTIPLHSSINRIKDLRQGQTIYGVYALGHHSFITKSIVMGRPFIDNNWYYGIDLKVYTDSPTMTSYTTTSSLKDFNMIPNNYNNHRVFTSRKKAESYLKLCKLCLVGLEADEGWGTDYYDRGEF